jgi:hypothetical protein
MSDYNLDHVNYYIDGYYNKTIKGGLAKQITKTLLPSIKEKDKDYLFIIDGIPRSGKSLFTMQLAKAIDPKYDEQQIVYNVNDFINLSLKIGKARAIHLDESYRSASRRKTLSNENERFKTFLDESGQLNHVYLLCTPDFTNLSYDIIKRSKGLFHIHHDREGRRGFWKFFNIRKMRQIYRLAEKGTYLTEQYTGPLIPLSSMKGRFYNQYPIDEEKYRVRKEKELFGNNEETEAEAKKETKTMITKLILQRTVLIKHITDNKILTLEAIEKLMADNGTTLDKSQMSRHNNKLKKKTEQEEKEK